jgi:phenylpyruvate tautomerase PptA (4-oxalocrotonate tautomerase family)
LPTVHVYVWEGFGKDRVKTLIQGITKVFGGLGGPGKRC